MHERKAVHAKCLLTMTCLRQFLPLGVLQSLMLAYWLKNTLAVCLECQTTTTSVATCADLQLVWAAA